MTTLLLCVCLGTCWLNCGCLSVTQATSAPETHMHIHRGYTLRSDTVWSIYPNPTEFCGMAYPAMPAFESLPGCGQQTQSNLQSHFTQGDSCKRMCEKANHLKPHPVKHGMWINVLRISTHNVLIWEGCGFERSGRIWGHGIMESQWCLDIIFISL